MRTLLTLLIVILSATLVSAEPVEPKNFDECIDFTTRSIKELKFNDAHRYIERAIRLAPPDKRDELLAFKATLKKTERDMKLDYRVKLVSDADQARIDARSEMEYQLLYQQKRQGQEREKADLAHFGNIKVNFKANRARNAATYNGLARQMNSWKTREVLE